MKMSLRNKRMFGGALVVAIVLSLTALVAFAQQGGGRDGRGFPPPGAPMHGGLFGPAGRDLNLTDAQKAQIKQIEDSFRESTKTLAEKMHALRQSEDATFAAGTFDEATVRAAAQERAAVQVELDVAHAKLMSQVFGVLTDDQKAKLAAAHKEFESHRGEFESRRGGGAPPEGRP
jgi:Spy/CpxP family protein refolding chaperone